MIISTATLNDLTTLTAMNVRLREDERADNAMTDKQVYDRMEGFLKGDYKAFLFEVDSTVYGYALVDVTKSPLYLRQFYIEREHRSKGFGSTAFNLLLKELKCETIDIDVLAWNNKGMIFWQKVGFEPRCVAMRYKKKV
ncbi:MAG: GNAT family N-acetyltransferase [Fibrobacteres bacterium]|nr:GNAT family N-acetyltransferase [Fibrobacterota bacterium]